MFLTTIILAKNEEKNIRDCILSVKFSEEIIVIDDNSSDLTKEISLRLGANVYQRNLNDDYAAQRNYGLKKASEEWVLFIDADERVSEILAKEISGVITEKKDISGYYLKRVDNIWGKQIAHGEIGSMQLLRLAKKDSGLWKRKVHEYWDVRGKLATLENSLVHYPHQNIAEFLKEINNYSRLHAESNFEEGKRSSLIKIIVFPMAKFIENFFIRQGYRDSVYGFVIALLMSLHSFLAWSNLWILQKQKYTP
jgi:glycosyltransferase involved in cell wall biosynthesis